VMAISWAVIEILGGWTVPAVGQSVRAVCSRKAIQGRMVAR
jgi:hypothetical protein